MGILNRGFVRGFCMGVMYGDCVWGFRWSFQMGILNGDFKWGCCMVCVI